MIDDIGKMAVTLHVYIDEIQGTYMDRNHGITVRQKKLIQKLVNKFLRYMKNTEYYYACDKRHATNYWEAIESHTNRQRKSDFDKSSYLTWIQYQIHRFIQDVYPTHYDGIFRVKGYSRFYKRTLEKLMR